MAISEDTWEEIAIVLLIVTIVLAAIAGLLMQGGAR